MTFCSTQVLSSPIITLNLGYNILTTEALDEQNGSAKGNNYELKIGKMEAQLEFGIFYGSGNYSVKIEHDNKNGKLSYAKTDLGLYLTYYRESIYFEGVGAISTIAEQLDGSFSNAEMTIVKDIYNYQKDKVETFGSSFLVGWKLMNFNTSILTLYFERSFLFDTDHSVTSGGIELKTMI